MLRYADYFGNDESKLMELLESSPAGLSDETARERLKQNGPNTVVHKKPDWKKILLRQANSFFIYLLLAAFTINLAIGERVDGSIIGAFVLIYIFAGFFQEYRAEKAIFNLQKFLSRYARVRRNGEIRKINLEELVPGDILSLKDGDLVPADVRFTYTRGLLVDESSLTGESVPVSKKDASVAAGEVSDDLQAPNLGFFGSTVTGGWARAIVIATGNSTYFAELFEKITHIERPSLFEKNIRQVAKLLANLILALAGCVFFVKISIVGHSDADFLVFLVAVVVAVVPEALPVVVALAFSRESLALAKKGTVVKRLTALEDLGNIDMLCTDKTGTITKNELTLAHSFTENEEVLFSFALTGSFGEHREHGKTRDPFDKALFEKASKDLADKVRRTHFLDALPFDPVHRINSVLYEKDGKKLLVQRGAPESILESATYYRGADGVSLPLDAAYKKKVLAWFAEKGHGGERILGVSFKEMSGDVQKIKPGENDGMILIGLLSFADPLKETSKEALALLQKLGVKLKIITGDAPEVAGAVGRELGLINESEAVMTGTEFEKLDREARIEAARTYQVFARTLPMQKYQIIEALKSAYAVGFLGEGLNDVPALEIADLAIVVDSATDMARNVADIILLKHDLLVITQGIAAGRKIFFNVIKYVRITLAANIGNFLTLTFAALALPFLPILSIQILLVNLITDMPMIAISLDTVQPVEVAKPQRYNLRYLYFFILVFGIVSVPFDFIFFGSFLKFGPAVLRTAWFLYSILQGLFAFFSLRSSLPITQSGMPARSVRIFSALAALLGIALVSYPPTRSIFHFTALGSRHFVLIALILCSYLAVNEAIKILYTRFFAVKT